MLPGRCSLHSTHRPRRGEVQCRRAEFGFNSADERFPSQRFASGKERATADVWRIRLRCLLHFARCTTARRTAAHLRSNPRRVYHGAGVLRKRASVPAQETRISTASAVQRLIATHGCTWFATNHIAIPTVFLHLRCGSACTRSSGAKAMNDDTEQKQTGKLPSGERAFSRHPLRKS